MKQRSTRRGNAMIELLVVLVIVAITSAAVLLLVSSGIISVRAQEEAVPLLNTEFIPFGQEGYLSIDDFQFCQSVDSSYNCINSGSRFQLGGEVHFVFTVESSTRNGDVIIVENYRIKAPDGRLLLDVDAKNDFYFDAKSRKQRELISFKDYFVVGAELPSGIYSLELVLENPLIQKKTTVVKTFEMV
ncbi:MAG: type II secretion system protein [Nanoarchaeota archaeon]|nr:type II secretion system protein [Nanoarchaeota archaeon]